MAQFNKKDFGENIRKNRLAKGLSQGNLADSLGKNVSTISRFERGELLPDAESISKICDILEISEIDLFGSRNKIKNTGNIKNPFKGNVLYMYFNAYDYRTKEFKKKKYKLELTNRPDLIRVDFIDLYDNKIYLSGYMLSDDSVVFIVFENYKANNRRLEISEIIINIDSGIDGLMLGTFQGTNSQYIPSIRKCYFSQAKVEFTKEMYDKLKITDREMKLLKEQNTLYLDIFNN